jgi:hypothetical protein
VLSRDLPVQLRLQGPLCEQPNHLVLDEETPALLQLPPWLNSFSQLLPRCPLHTHQTCDCSLLTAAIIPSGILLYFLSNFISLGMQFHTFGFLVSSPVLG